MTYNRDDYGVLRVYDEYSRIIAEVSDCGNMTKQELENLATEVYEERSK